MLEVGPEGTYRGLGVVHIHFAIFEEIVESLCVLQKSVIAAMHELFIEYKYVSRAIRLR